MHPALGGRQPDMQHRGPPAGVCLFEVFARSPELNQQIVCSQPADRSQGVQLGGIAVGRRRGQEHDAPRSGGDGMCGCQPRGKSRTRVRFVDYNEVPRDFLQRAQYLGTLDEVEGRNVDSREAPGVDVGWQFPRGRGEPPRIGDGCGEREALVQLLAPLVPQAGGREDDGAKVVAVLRELGEEQPRLDRLAQPHVICDQQPRAGVAAHGERRFELKRQEIDARARGSRERSERTGAGRATKDISHPTLLADDPRRLREIRRLDPIERDEQRARGAGIRWRHSRQADGGTVAVRDVTRDVPRITAGEDTRGWLQGLHAAAEGQPQCHRKSTAKPLDWARQGGRGFEILRPRPTSRYADPAMRAATRSPGRPPVLASHQRPLVRGPGGCGTRADRPAT